MTIGTEVLIKPKKTFLEIKNGKCELVEKACDIESAICYHITNRHDTTIYLLKTKNGDRYSHEVKK